MKELILLTFLFFAKLGFSQTYQYTPFPDSNAIWTMNGYWLDGSHQPHYSNFQYYLNGDTIYNGAKWSKVYYRGTYQYYDQFQAGINGILRNDTTNKIIYYKRFGVVDNDSILYNFTLNLGDTIPDNWYTIDYDYIGEYFYIYDIDTILINNAYRRVFYLKDNTAVLNEILIEGIGSSQGFNTILQVPFEDDVVLSCFSQNDTTLWPNIIYEPCEFISSINEAGIPDENAILITPNPFTDKIVVHRTSGIIWQHPTVQVINILGQTLLEMKFQSDMEITTSQFPNGFYIVIVYDNNRVVSLRKIIKG